MPSPREGSTGRRNIEGEPAATAAVTLLSARLSPRLLHPLLLLFPLLALARPFVRLLLPCLLPQPLHPHGVCSCSCCCRCH